MDAYVRQCERRHTYIVNSASDFCSHPFPTNHFFFIVMLNTWRVLPYKYDLSDLSGICDHFLGNALPSTPRNSGWQIYQLPCRDLETPPASTPPNRLYLMAARSRKVPLLPYHISKNNSPYRSAECSRAFCTSEPSRSPTFKELSDITKAIKQKYSGSSSVYKASPEQNFAPLVPQTFQHAHILTEGSPQQKTPTVTQKMTPTLTRKKKLPKPFIPPERVSERRRNAGSKPPNQTTSGWSCNREESGNAGTKNKHEARAALSPIKPNTGFPSVVGKGRLKKMSFLRHLKTYKTAPVVGSGSGTEAKQRLSQPVAKSNPGRRKSTKTTSTRVGKRNPLRKAKTRLDSGDSSLEDEICKKATTASGCSTAHKAPAVSRDYYGCWTCRVRHRPCPADGPPCKTCRRFGYECDMSLTRPAYIKDPKKKRKRMRYLQETRQR